jgi:hypothetical protein
MFSIFARSAVMFALLRVQFCDGFGEVGECCFSIRLVHKRQMDISSRLSLVERGG